MLVAWFLSRGPAGILNMCCQGRLGNTWELLSRGAHSSGHNSSWPCAYREGGKYKCLFGNVSPTCARPFPISLLTSPYPQGDAAPMGAPGEKGPNGLPVSMEQDLPPLGTPAAQGACRDPSWGRGGSSCGLLHKELWLSQEEMHFSHHADREGVCQTGLGNSWSSTTQ